MQPFWLASMATGAISWPPDDRRARIAAGRRARFAGRAGHLGGRADMLMMRIVDILYALPFIFFVILLIVFFGRHFVLIFVAIGAIEWLDMARIVRGQTLSLKRQEFVLAAEALGV